MLIKSKKSHEGNYGNYDRIITVENEGAFIKVGVDSTLFKGYVDFNLSKKAALKMAIALIRAAE